MSDPKKKVKGKELDRVSRSKGRIRNTRLREADDCGCDDCDVGD